MHERGYRGGVGHRTSSPASCPWQQTLISGAAFSWGACSARGRASLRLRTTTLRITFPMFPSSAVSHRPLHQNGACFSVEQPLPRVAHHCAVLQLPHVSQQRRVTPAPAPEWGLLFSKAASPTGCTPLRCASAPPCIPAAPYHTSPCAIPSTRSETMYVAGAPAMR